MGDTIFKEFDENWTEVAGLTLDVSYSFQNVNSADLFLQQVPTQPEEGEIGKRLPPSISAQITKEASPIWVRSKTTKGIAIYNEVPPTGGGGSGDGDVVGPASAVDENIAVYDGTTGKLIKDSGINVTNIGTGDVVGPGSSIAGNVPSFVDASGKLLGDSGIDASDIVEGPASAGNDNIAVYDNLTGKLIKDSGINVSSIGAGAFPVVVFTSDPLNLVVADNLTLFVMDASFQQDITIPQNSSEAFPVGAEMHFLREGTGAVMFFSTGSVVLQSRDGLVNINTQYSAAALKKIDTDEWRLIGDLA